jgi:conserved oligomeric Golgi complex subunit 8
LAPSRVLLEYPPLAVLTNGFLHALNELRQCAILSIRPQLARVLYQQIEEIVASLVTQKSTARSPARQKDLASLAQGAAEHFVPFIDRCFNAVFQTTLSLLDVAALLHTLETLFERKSVRPTSHSEPSLRPAHSMPIPI